MVKERDLIGLFSTVSGPTNFPSAKKYFDEVYIPKLEGDRARQIRIKEMLARANKHFVNGLEKLEFIIKTTEGLKNYAKKIGKKPDEFTKALEVLKFYWSGYMFRVELNILNNVKTIRQKINKIRILRGTRASTYFSLSENHKNNFDPETVTKQPNSFVGGLKKSFILGKMGAGYGTSVRGRNMNVLFNKSLDKDWKSYAKLIRQIREQLAFCKAGTLNWLENIVRLNEGLHLELLKKSEESKLKENLGKILNPIEGKKRDTIFKKGATNIKVRLPRDFADIEKRCNVSGDGIQRDHHYFKTIKTYAGVPFKSPPNLLNILQTNGLIEYNNGDDSSLTKDLEFYDEKLKGYRIAIFKTGSTNPARDKFIELLRDIKFKEGTNYTVGNEDFFMFIKDELDGKKIQGNNSINSQFLIKYRGFMKQKYPNLAKKIWKIIQDDTLTVIGAPSTVKVSSAHKNLSVDIALNPSVENKIPGSVSVDKMKFQFVPLDFKDISTRLKSELPELKVEDFRTLFKKKSNDFWLAELKNRFSVSNPDDFRLALFFGVAKNALIAKLGKKFTNVVNKPVLMFLSEELGDNSNLNKKHITSHPLSQYLDNYEDIITNL